MSLSNILFADNLPKIDLHGLDRETARVFVTDFINEQKKLKNNVFIIVHGIGSGILRSTTLDTLKKNKLVIEFQTSFFNPGCTIVKIKL
ncbi:MAG: Smr/MutS family protein [Bacilli bacterium]